MSEPNKRLILVVDDDSDMRSILERFLERASHQVVTCADGPAALSALKTATPDLILTDVMMPGMDGYALCARLQADPALSMIPVIFVTTLSGERDRAAALAAGGVDFLTKPVVKADLLALVQKHLDHRQEWEKLADAQPLAPRRSGDYRRFLFGLAKELALPQELRERLAHDAPGDLYAMAYRFGLSNNLMAKHAAAFLKFDYLSYLNPNTLVLGVLPAPFCRAHGIVVIEREPGTRALVVSNPFQQEVLDSVRQFAAEGVFGDPLVTEPENISRVLKRPDREAVEELLRSDSSKVPVSEISSAILDSAVYQRASDIHIEPKASHTVVRIRVDGDMREAYRLQPETGLMLVSRLKTLGEMDVADRRKPQDGAMQCIIDGRAFIIRLATSSTPSGESLVMRLLEPWVKAKTLAELGMTESQVQQMMEFARRQSGMVLVAGPTGSGKTTTIYSLLQHIDCKARSLLSIEDPVEYRIPDANQQQVDEKGGLTFENLLKSSLRQDPDILFLGEIRDDFSAKMAIDFASTGHLTISSVHTTNATTAVFRLERVGVTRGAMADSILGVVAQKLLKKLCLHCKLSGPILEEERQMLAPFTSDIPEQVFRPVGCLKCGGSGYLGREGLYEIVKFYPEISEMIRRNAPISEIRAFARQRGDYLAPDHAIEKVRAGIFSPKDIFEQVLIEESEYLHCPTGAAPVPAPPPVPPAALAATNAPDEDLIGRPLPSSVNISTGIASRILVAEDDADTLDLIKHVLSSRGHLVTGVRDGIEALLQLGGSKFDLILADINMPNLDGLRLAEFNASKQIDTPIIFCTGQVGSEVEKRAFDLGAADFIRKPVAKGVLVVRVERVLAARKTGQESK